MTTSFVPLEVMELYRRQTWLRGLLLVFNVAIVVYLILRVRREHKAEKSAV